MDVQTRLIFFFGFKYKQHYLAPHITTIKTCTIIVFFFFPSLSFPLILLDRNEGKKWQGLEMLTPFKLNFKFSLTFSQEKKKKNLNRLSKLDSPFILELFY